MSKVNLFPWSPYLTAADKAAFDAGASALVRAPVCPRCLDIEHGKPGADPSVPHPGPFTPGLCAACSGNPPAWPTYEGEQLSWSVGLYDTIREIELGHPRARAVIRAMKEQRPQLLRHEYDECLRGLFGMFDGTARRQMKLILSECPELEAR